jgi:polysaccharide biosynthesis protein PslG
VLGVLWVAAVGGALILLIGGDEERQVVDAPPLPRAECPSPALGVHATLAFERDPARRTASIVAIKNALQAQIVRDSLLWHQIEPTEGRRDWSRLDSIVAQLRERDIEPLLVVVGSPSWANGIPSSVSGHHLQVPPPGPRFEQWLDRYAEFVAEAVRRYRTSVRRWELWNEPNLARFWRPAPDVEAYRRLYVRLRQTILDVDPDALVAVGGITNLTVSPPPDRVGVEFLREFLSTRPPVDHVAIHPYMTRDHPPGVHVEGQNNFDDIERVREELVAQGEQAPLWVTEWGWSSAVVGEDAQARFVDASLTRLEQLPYVRVATYFADHDKPPEFLHGLLRADLQPKRAAVPFRRHAQRLAAGCRPAGQATSGSRP